jgi:diguanylate cyclase (GGDEF)-like protein
MFRVSSFRSKCDLEGEKFRQEFLFRLTIAAVVSTFAIVAGAVAGLVTPLSALQLYANILSVCVGLIVAILTWAFPDRWGTLAWIETANCVTTILIALYSMPDDELRYVWFFVQAGGTFLLLGPVAGWLGTIFTITVVAVSKSLGLIWLSDIATGTFCIGLLGITAVLHAYHSQAILYREHLRTARDDAKFAAEHDPLTGLYNRSAFNQISADIWRDRRADQFPVALIFMDIDHFKKINDVFGHHAGDLVLQAVSQTVTDSVRRTDIVARMGGEEIVVLLPGTDETYAFILAERMRANLEKCCPVVNGVPLNVTASFGWSVAASSEVSVDEILKSADEAMYLAKSKGRNRVYPPLQGSKAVDETDVEIPAV